MVEVEIFGESTGLKKTLLVIKVKRTVIIFLKSALKMELKLILLEMVQTIMFFSQEELI